MELMPHTKFRTPEEEIAYLRNEIAVRERILKEEKGELDRSEKEEIGHEVVRSYSETDPDLVLEKKHSLLPRFIEETTARIEGSNEQVANILKLAEEKGIKNALTVLSKLNEPFITDETHKALIALIREGQSVKDLKEGGPLWNVLHMTLFEVALPHLKNTERAESITALFSGMEQFFAGMQTIAESRGNPCYTIEIAVEDKSDDIVFYMAIPNEYVNLFEKQALSLFPHALLREHSNDYNVFVEGGVSEVTTLGLKKHPIYPIRTYDTFERDPLVVLLNAFSNIERTGGGAALQFVIQGGARKYHDSYSNIVKRMEKGENTETAIRKSTLGGELIESVKELWLGDTKKKTEDMDIQKTTDSNKIELFKKKLASPILGTNIRLIASSEREERAHQIMTELESCFAQFQNTEGNQISQKRHRGSEKARELRAFSFREYLTNREVPLSLKELSTIIHFPDAGNDSTPQFRQSRAKQAPAPVDLPQEGTLLGVNEFRNKKIKAFLTPEDRLRHFYVIGQTGTGKTTLIKNMIMQDIEAGAGVCMIDPHGSDIIDVLSSIPPDRIDDLIYFDPSNLDHVMGLNMLEYDEQFPEQKTFVVNELFSIFQKLYGGSPESMGPIFEQYFRNATLLVLEDPDSGSTLLDISRVMADAVFRRLKLSKATNPVVLQFWQQIASKAGGDAALENIVPYITSKFDVFTANDYMRPIIGQQHSSFNFREIMDTKKILLVNLSKGRLGEINANLIGMIIVGKILMAALSRVDSALSSNPPFYLYIDEFQNVTTNSISAILSEARKYKLGLTIAHQFVAQIDDTIRNAVFGNVGSIGAFRVGADDAEFLARQFAPVFGPHDLMNIENQNAYVRILANGSPRAPFNIHTMQPPQTDPEYAKQLIEYSNLTHGRARHIVEADIQARYAK